MEEARAVIARLDRIEAMERGLEPAELVLAELALLAAEVERWLEREQAPGDSARRALEDCLQALEADPSARSERGRRRLDLAKYSLG